MEAHEPLGPPELGKDPKPADSGTTNPVPQLVRSKPTMLPQKPADETPDEPFYDEPDPLNEHVDYPGDPDGVVAAEEKELWQKSQTGTEADEPIIPPRRKRIWLRMFIIFVLLVAATFAAYAIGSRAGAPAKPQTTKRSSVVAKKPATKTPAALTFKDYTSSNFSLAFSYPTTWKVSDTPAAVTITSPDTKLTNAAGAQVATRVVITVAKKQTTIPNYPAAGAVEVLPPYVMTYDRPSPIQSGQTYVTYAGYGQADGLDAIFVSGDNGYVQNQAIPESDIVAADPLVSVTFTTCPDTSCATPAAVTLQASGWQSSDMAKTVTKILQSFQFQ